MSSSDHYDPCPISISGSSNPVLPEEKIHSRTQEQPPSRILVHNVDEDEEKEE
jgi:hypothetical protein